LNHERKRKKNPASVCHASRIASVVVVFVKSRKIKQINFFLSRSHEVVSSEDEKLKSNTEQAFKDHVACMFEESTKEVRRS
jgi:hypothetical protein